MENLYIKTNKKKVKKLGLALGGGGARGFALIGVLKAFEENNIKFDFVSGTSVGSIIGAMYCAGISADEMKAFAMKLKDTDIRKSYIPFTPSKSDRLEETVRRLLGNITFNELKIPFVAVACDMRTGEEVHLDKGDVARAVCGSSAVPGVFYPVEFGDYLLFDGGLINNIPANVPKLHGCEVTIGVDINATRGTGTNSEKYIDLVFQSIGIMMKSNAIKGYLNSDVMIMPDLKKFSSSKFDGAEEMFEIGYKSTIEKMPEILAFFERRHKNQKRKFKWLFNLFSRPKKKNEEQSKG